MTIQAVAHPATMPRQGAWSPRIRRMGSEGPNRSEIASITGEKPQHQEHIGSTT
jgi:hypothetical protein